MKKIFILAFGVGRRQRIVEDVFVCYAIKLKHLNRFLNPYLFHMKWGFDLKLCLYFVSYLMIR